MFFFGQIISPLFLLESVGSPWPARTLPAVVLLCSGLPANSAVLSKLLAAHHDFPGCAQPIFHIASCFLFFFFSNGLRFGNLLAGTCSQFCQENKNRSRIRCVPHLRISHLSLHQCTGCLSSTPPELYVVFGEGCLTQMCPSSPAGWYRATGLFFPEQRKSQNHILPKERVYLPNSLIYENYVEVASAPLHLGSTSYFCLLSQLSGARTCSLT